MPTCAFDLAKTLLVHWAWICVHNGLKILITVSIDGQSPELNSSEMSESQVCLFIRKQLSELSLPPSLFVSSGLSWHKIVVDLNVITV